MIGIAKIKNKIHAGLTIEAQVSANRVSLETAMQHPSLFTEQFSCNPLQPAVAFRYKLDTLLN